MDPEIKDWILSNPHWGQVVVDELSLLGDVYSKLRKNHINNFDHL